jgi:hypothetical protein
MHETLNNKQRPRDPLEPELKKSRREHHDFEAQNEGLNEI